MLMLKNIKKDYVTGSETVQALKGVSISFRKNEFVSILGQSGCGKTTLLNIVGGLDQYTSGDLVINGKSTKKYKAKDWDTYRNHSIGFVFQSYNLITHQTVLSNVELALTLSGVSKEERRKRAKRALERVGLGDQLRKKPTQMSGGQMQRVAIARALVNDPDILLADEPTGALDSKTSVQIMEILKEISKDKLVIMVTHNSELADEYSTRIIKLHDGLVVDDSNEYTEEELLQDEANAPKAVVETKKEKFKKQMSFLTALALSFNNLMTKKGRTLLTAFAGSIGIIGIALILSLSTGIQTYIDKVQEETLSSYPVYLEAEATDLSTMMNGYLEASESSGNHDLDKVYSNSTVYELFNSLNKIGQVKNNLKGFKTFLLENKTLHSEYIAAIQYSYDLDLRIVNIDENKNITQVNPSELTEKMMEAIFGASISGSTTSSSTSMMMGGGMSDIFCEIIPANDGGYINDIIYNQYELVYGDWPNDEDEIVLIVNENNEISDLTLYALGIKDQKEFIKLIEAWKKGEDITVDPTSYEFDYICNELDYRIVLPTDFYTEDPLNPGVWVDRSKDVEYLKLVYAGAKELKIEGIIRPKAGTTATALTGSIGYTYGLTEWYINQINNSDIVKAQKENPNTDILSGMPFKTEDNVPQTPAEKKAKIDEYLETLNDSEKVALYKEIYSTPTDEEVNAMYQMMTDGKTVEQIRLEIIESLQQSGQGDISTIINMINSMSDEQFMMYYEVKVKEQIASSVKESKLAALNMMPESQVLLMMQQDLSTADDNRNSYIYDNFIPSGLSEMTLEENLKLLGSVDLDDPKAISIYAKDFAAKDKIAELINTYNSGVGEEDKISYTDYVALIMSGVSTIIDAISYVLIGFVSVSLIVSSIMIGIITYISVLERTKEIGILRAIGASKRDVSRVFRAETIIEGFAAGMIGILMTILICIPINAILYALSGIPGLKAVLPIKGAVILVVISILLTLIAGMMPSRVAAKKDPVEALRTE